MKSGKHLLRIATVCVLAIFLFHASDSPAAQPASVTRPPKSSTSNLKSATNVHGRTRLPSFVRVLSFDELMRLPRAKRVAYIHGLRSMMKALDRVSPKLRASAPDASSYSQIARLLEIYDATETVAWATESAVASSDLPTVVAGAVKCGAGFEAVRINGPSDSESEATNFVCVKGARGTAKCPGDMMPVNQDAKGLFSCASLASFNRLPDNLKGIARHQAHKPSLFDGQAGKHFSEGYPDAMTFGELKIQIVDAAKMGVLPGAGLDAKKVAVNGRANGAKAPAAPPKLATLPASAKPGSIVPGRLSASGTNAEASAKAPVPSAPAPDAPSAAATSQNASAPSKTVAPETIVVSPVTPADSRPGATDGAAASSTTSSTDAASSSDVTGSSAAGTTSGAKDDPPPAPAALATCEPESETPKTCNSDEVEKARQKYASDPDPDCIYAGGISTYIDGKKRAYHCQAPTEFCFGSTTCTNDAGEKMTADYSCSSGKVICNPLVFGLDSDGQSPFCVDKSAHATADCDTQAATIEDGKSPLDQKHPGLREAWNDFADRLFKLCHTNQISAALHCAECDIISKRLFALNVAARDVKNCGAAIKYEEKNCDADGSCSVRPGVTPDAQPAPAAAGSSKKVSVRGGAHDGRNISSVPNTKPIESVWEKK